MSILFGIRQAEEQIVEEPQLRRMASATDRYAPDGTFLKAAGRIGMGFQPYHTHQRSNLGSKLGSKLESQPAVSERGDMLAFDGRLDNYAELCHWLNLDHAQNPDSAIVLEAFRRWGEDCFSRLVGEWALALWCHTERSLYLARDHAGSRTLYYEMTVGGVFWSTYLESLLPQRSARGPDELFATAYLSSLPIRDLTPYRGIHAVSPAHYLVIREDAIIRKPHWPWMVRETIQYGSDRDYDEHFSSLFRQSVERRTGPGAPILAELSGGMDSSSIVCMSDHIRKEQGAGPEDLIDTVSYYDDSEPNWNEKPYFTAVEQARGKRGLHIEASSLGQTFESPAPEYLWPGADSGTLARERQLEDQLGYGKYRVILSGIGGDELLGGTPNALPELADCLVSGQFRKLMSQAFYWCLAKRLPLLHLLRDTAALAIALYGRAPQPTKKAPPWLAAALREQIPNLRFHDFPSSRTGLLPTAIDKGLTWWSIMETLPRPSQRILVRREVRYPFLDRDLVDFLLRVPANQLMRPGRRRLLMRRAFHSLLPVEVLERRRKAYVARGPWIALSNDRPRLISLLHHSHLKSLGYVEEDVLRSAIADLDIPSQNDRLRAFMQAIRLEMWMQGSTENRVQTEFSPG